MRPLIQLVGIPGVGKTKLLSLLAPQYEPSLGIIDFGTEFKSWLNGCESTDANNNDLLKQFVDAHVFARQPAIVSSHVVHYTGGGFEFDPSIEKYMNSQIYVSLEANPVDILNRRKRDEQSKKRSRPAQSVDLIGYHQDLSRSKVEELARELGSSYHRVINGEGEINETLTKLKEIIKLLK